MDNFEGGLDGILEEHDDLNEMIDAAAGEGTRVQINERSADPLKHFQLTTRPFADNVNPEFFYRTEAHEEAFLAMKQCIEEHVSLGLTTAVSGTGKTLLTQVLMHELDPRQYQTVLVLAYPGMSRTALLREVADELKLEDLPARPTLHTLINAIQSYIIRLYLKGLRLVLIIDEVHFLNADSLHLLRTLSNIEVPEQKLVSVLLFGENVFLQKLRHPVYRSIFSRMFARTVLRPLKPEEIAQYVKFRLLVAGGKPTLFAADTFALIHKYSGGIPREINRVCHNAMSLAARLGRGQITPDLLELLVKMKKI